MAEVVLLDGSVGQELVRRSPGRATALWSTRVMMDHPDMVGALHRDYFASGATIATTNTYALHRNRLALTGQEAMLPELLDIALLQAETARASWPSRRIAGSLGPLFASYRPDLDPDPVEAERQFAWLASRMASRVDLLVAETVCSTREAEGVLRGMAHVGIPRWIAFSTMDNDGTCLRSGETLTDIAPLLARFRPDAVLINCTRPEAVPAGLCLLAPMGISFGAYANGFTHISDDFLKDAPTVDSLGRRADLDPAAYADHALSWLAQGATILGGCCEIGPAHISELARRLRAAGHIIR